MIFYEKLSHFGIKIAYLIILGEILRGSHADEQNHGMVFMIYPKGLKEKCQYK
jgi:hypothetical protein